MLTKPWGIITLHTANLAVKTIPWHSEVRIWPYLGLAKVRICPKRNYGEDSSELDYKIRTTNQMKNV